MVTLPPDFVATRFPGYFWNLEEKELYTMKISGVLRPLKRKFPNSFNKLNQPGYYVSSKGKRKFFSLGYLHSLESEYSVIPVENKNVK